MKSKKVQHGKEKRVDKKKVSWLNESPCHKAGRMMERQKCRCEH